MKPSELYIPDGSGQTITQRVGNHYGYLPNGHKASLVRIKIFIPYFETNLFVIDHHMGDLYLYDRDSRGVELLAIQATNLQSQNDGPNVCQLVTPGPIKQICLQSIIQSIFTGIKIIIKSFI